MRTWSFSLPSSFTTRNPGNDELAIFCRFSERILIKVQIRNALHQLLLLQSTHLLIHSSSKKLVTCFHALLPFFNGRATRKRPFSVERGGLLVAPPKEQQYSLILYIFKLTLYETKLQDIIVLAHSRTNFVSGGGMVASSQKINTTLL